MTYASTTRPTTPRSASAWPSCAGLPFETVLVDRRTRQQDSAAFRRLNPMGLIPRSRPRRGRSSRPAPSSSGSPTGHGAGLAPAPQDPDRGGSSPGSSGCPTPCIRRCASFSIPDRTSRATPARSFPALWTGFPPCSTSGPRGPRPRPLLGARPRASSTATSPDAALAPALRGGRRRALRPSPPWPQPPGVRAPDGRSSRASWRPRPRAWAPTPFSAPRLPNPPEGSPT
jgi:glutathione S-transferase